MVRLVRHDHTRAIVFAWWDRTSQTNSHAALELRTFW